MGYPVGYFPTIYLHVNFVPWASWILGIIFTWTSFSFSLGQCMSPFNINKVCIISIISSGTFFITLSSIYVWLFFPLRRGGTPIWLRTWRIFHISFSFSSLSYFSLSLGVRTHLCDQVFITYILVFSFGVIFVDFFDNSSKKITIPHRCQMFRRKILQGQSLSKVVPL